MEYTHLYIVRHGESVANVQGIIQGHADYPLTKNGEKQALARAKSLKHIVFERAFSSDLMRAQRTAEIIAFEHHLTVTTTEALRERRYGTLEKTARKDFTKEIQQAFDAWADMTHAQWMKHRLNHSFETGEEMVSRFMLFIREIAVGYPGKNILTVCHGDLMRNVLVHLGWPTRGGARNFLIENTSYFELVTDGVDCMVKEVHGIEPVK